MTVITYVPDGREHVCKQCRRTFDCTAKLRDHIVRTHESATAEVLT